MNAIITDGVIKDGMLAYMTRLARRNPEGFEKVRKHFIAIVIKEIAGRYSEEPAKARRVLATLTMLQHRIDLERTKYKNLLSSIVALSNMMFEHPEGGVYHLLDTLNRPDKIIEVKEFPKETTIIPFKK